MRSTTHPFFLPLRAALVHAEHGQRQEREAEDGVDRNVYRVPRGDRGHGGRFALEELVRRQGHHGRAVRRNFCRCEALREHQGSPLQNKDNKAN